MKPSPVTSILLFVGAALLLFAAVSASWFKFGDGDFSVSVGLVRGEQCSNGHCSSMSIFSGHMGLTNLLAIVVFLLSMATAILGVIAGIKLLKPGKTVLAVLAMSLVAGAMLFALIYTVQVSGLKMSYGVFVFFAGAASALVGAILGMSRPGVPRPMGMRPGMRPGFPGQQPFPGQGYPPQGHNPYGPGPQAPNPYGAPQPGVNPYAPQGAQPGNPYAPQGAQPQGAQPQGAQPQGQPGGPQPQAAQGAPCPTCGTPPMWVAQYGRMFCQRCNKYL